LPHGEAFTKHIKVINEGILEVAALGFGFALRTMPNGAATVLIGLSAGMFNGLAAMPGPPAVAYYMACPLRPKSVRASLLVFFAITSFAAAASLLITGLLQTETALLTIGGLPIMFIGTWLGERLFEKSAGRMHRLISLLLLAVIAVLSGSNACTAPNNLDTGEGLRCGGSGLWASALTEECHRARPGQAQAAVAGACGPA
jgi:hypothetical protein